MMATERGNRAATKAPTGRRSLRERIGEVLTMTTAGLLVSVVYVAWVGLFVFSTNDLA